VVTGFLADYFTGDDEQLDQAAGSVNLDSIAHKLDEIIKAQKLEAEAVDSLQSRIDKLEQLLKMKDSK